jgi:hypothetical protein
MVATLGIEIDNVAVAADKGKAVAREAVVSGGGFAGGAGVRYRGGVCGGRAGCRGG